MPKLYIASDHAGFQLKKTLSDYIEKKLKQKITDLGPDKYEKTDDYPDYAVPLAKKVAKTKGFGILICNNGIGVCIAANKVKGIRAGIGYSTMAAKTMREDDNTNIICLAAGALTKTQAKKIIKTWIDTSFSKAPRHKRRLKKVSQLDK